MEMLCGGISAGKKAAMKMREAVLHALLEIHLRQGFADV
jgi:hypothetical protein